MAALRSLVVLCLIGFAASDMLENGLPAPSPSAMSPSPSPARMLQASTVSPPVAPPPVVVPSPPPPPAVVPTPSPPVHIDPVVGGSIAAGVIGVTAIGLGAGLGTKYAGEDHHVDKYTAKCALNGARAVDDMLDAAVYILASIARCDGHDTIRCEVDVASAIESVNKMINVILKAVDKCGALHGSHAKCGLSVGVLTRSMASLAAAAGGIVAKCPNKLNGGHPLDTVGTAMEKAGRYGGHRAFKTAGFSIGFGQCVINIKDTVKSLFKAIKRIMTVRENCMDPHNMHCAHNSIKIVAAFTGLAEYISGSIAKCSANSAHQVNAVCAQMSIRLLHAIQEVDRASTGLAMDCHISEAERLYLEEEDNAASVTPVSSSGSVTFALAALLPVTAVVGFLGGKRLANARTQPSSDSRAALATMEVE